MDDVSIIVLRVDKMSIIRIGTGRLPARRINPETEMTTTQRVAKIVTSHREVSGDAAFVSHRVQWVADQAGDYIEISRKDGSKGYHHILDWDRFTRNYPGWAA
jgi:hypothetical protein